MQIEFGAIHPVDMHIGSRLRTLRLLLGQSQSDFAEKLGLGFRQVQKYETGANRISASKLFKISEKLGVTPGYFFVGLEETVSPNISMTSRQLH